MIIVETKIIYRSLLSLWTSKKNVQTSMYQPAAHLLNDQISGYCNSIS